MKARPLVLLLCLFGAAGVLRGDQIDLSNKHTGLYAKYRAEYRQLGLVK
jgi:hypothetical protein